MKQACSVRDARDELTAAGVVVIGISPDLVTAQDRFDRKNGLAFPLLSDPDGRVARAYGAWGVKKAYGRESEGVVRSAFVVDEKGKVVGALYRVTPEETVPGARRALGL